MGSVGRSKEEYRYHATTAPALVGIYRDGLKPSKRGMFGKSVYMSDSEKKALDWAAETTEGNELLRVNMSYLKEKTDYADLDNTQGLTTKKIPTKHIEIKNWQGEWESLESYAKRYWRSFGIKKP